MAKSNSSKKTSQEKVQRGIRIRWIIASISLLLFVAVGLLIYLPSIYSSQSISLRNVADQQATYTFEYEGQDFTAETDILTRISDVSFADLGGGRHLLRITEPRFVRFDESRGSLELMKLTELSAYEGWDNFYGLDVDRDFLSSDLFGLEGFSWEGQRLDPIDVVLSPYFRVPDLVTYALFDADSGQIEILHTSDIEGEIEYGKDVKRYRGEEISVTGFRFECGFKRCFRPETGATGLQLNDSEVVFYGGGVHEVFDLNSSEIEPLQGEQYFTPKNPDLYKWNEGKIAIMGGAISSPQTAALGSSLVEDSFFRGIRYRANELRVVDLNRPFRQTVYPLDYQPGQGESETVTNIEGLGLGVGSSKFALYPSQESVIAMDSINVGPGEFILAKELGNAPIIKITKLTIEEGRANQDLLGVVPAPGEMGIDTRTLRQQDARERATSGDLTRYDFLPTLPELERGVDGRVVLTLNIGSQRHQYPSIWRIDAGQELIQPVDDYIDKSPHQNYKPIRVSDELFTEEGLSDLMNRIESSEILSVNSEQGVALSLKALTDLFARAQEESTSEIQERKLESQFLLHLISRIERKKTVTDSGDILMLPGTLEQSGSYGLNLGGYLGQTILDLGTDGQDDELSPTIDSVDLNRGVALFSNDELLILNSNSIQSTLKKLWHQMTGWRVFAMEKTFSGEFTSLFGESEDLYEEGSREGTGDLDGDGIPNYADDDSDGDGVPDRVECPGYQTSRPLDSDACDENDNDIPDHLEADFQSRLTQTDNPIRIASHSNLGVQPAAQSWSSIQALDRLHHLPTARHKDTAYMLLLGGAGEDSPEFNCGTGFDRTCPDLDPSDNESNQGDDLLINLTDNRIHHLDLETTGAYLQDAAQHYSFYNQKVYLVSVSDKDKLMVYKEGENFFELIDLTKLGSGESVTQRSLSPADDLVFNKPIYNAGKIAFVGSPALLPPATSVSSEEQFNHRRVIIYDLEGNSAHTARLPTNRSGFTLVPYNNTSIAVVGGFSFEQVGSSTSGGLNAFNRFDFTPEENILFIDLNDPDDISSKDISESFIMPGVVKQEGGSLLLAGGYQLTSSAPGSTFGEGVRSFFRAQNSITHVFPSIPFITLDWTVDKLKSTQHGEYSDSDYLGSSKLIYNSPFQNSRALSGEYNSEVLELAYGQRFFHLKRDLLFGSVVLPVRGYGFSVEYISDGKSIYVIRPGDDFRARLIQPDSSANFGTTGFSSGTSESVVTSLGEYVGGNYNHLEVSKLQYNYDPLSPFFKYGLFQIFKIIAGLILLWIFLPKIRFESR